MHRNLKVNVYMQSAYTYVAIVTGQKYITNCDFHRSSTSILLSLHTTCRFRLRGLSFSHEHEILILLRISVTDVALKDAELTLLLRRSRMGTVWFYTSTSNKKAARPKLYTKSLTRDLKRMYSHLTLVRIFINL